MASRQREYQKRMKAAGRCERCGQKREDHGVFCPKCQIKYNNWQNRRRLLDRQKMV
jgi:predicted amidophosphoribosyltransferase